MKLRRKSDWNIFFVLYRTEFLQHNVTSQDGLKYAILCRVLCGVPGDDPSEIDDKDCIILKVVLQANTGRSFAWMVDEVLGVYSILFSTIIIRYSPFQYSIY